MSGVIVLIETRDGAPRPFSGELLGAALALSKQGVGGVAVVSIDEGAEAHVVQDAVAQLIAQRQPSLVLAGHTIASLGFAPALAARGGHGFASDVTEVSWGDHGALARRPVYGERLIAELDFPGKQTVVLLLRAGAFAPTNGGALQDTPVEHAELDLAGAPRSERIELREPPGAGVELDKADFLLALGRGVGTAEKIAPLERLATALGATVCVSGPLVEAGWAPRTRKVGVSGKTVAPLVYLALGISGAAQHLAGMSRARTIIAVNSDPRARIFDFAHYGAVADLFEIAAELERLSA
ncbi:MAG TPA: electron transfer flavoprotein subunit alpha/FixB family protein [Solirubrobacteraceae bacterium]